MTSKEFDSIERGFERIQHAYESILNHLDSNKIDENEIGEFEKKVDSLKNRITAWRDATPYDPEETQHPAVFTSRWSRQMDGMREEIGKRLLHIISKGKREEERKQKETQIQQHLTTTSGSVFDRYAKEAAAIEAEEWVDVVPEDTTPDKPKAGRSAVVNPHEKKPKAAEKKTGPSEVQKWKDMHKKKRRK